MTYSKLSRQLAVYAVHRFLSFDMKGSRLTMIGGPFSGLTGVYIN